MLIYIAKPEPEAKLIYIAKPEPDWNIRQKIWVVLS